MAAAAQTIQPQLNEKYINSDLLGARITELHAYITAATHQFLMLVAEFDEKGYWHQIGVCSCAHWLNWKCGIGMNAAREKVRVARALQGLPKISQSFARGEISYSKVRAITRAAKRENEDYLLMFARHGTAYHVEKLVAGYKKVNRLRDEAEGRVPNYHRELHTHWDDDGCLVVTARLPAEKGALLLKAMDLAVDRQYEAARETKDGGDADYAQEETPLEKSERLGARRADALAEMAEAYLDNEAPNGSSADRYQVVVHVAAKASSRESFEMPRLDNGPRVSAETSRRLGCDSSIVPVFKGIKGEPLSVGRKTRAIPPSIMRALRIRDGGCRFPGCTNTRFTDGHHIRHWADGGETSLNNLVLLCRHHHGLVHEGGFGCEVNRHGGVIFKSPRGPGALGANILQEAFQMTAPAGVQEPVAWLSSQIDCDHMDSSTCVTRWTGERCDWDLAVGHLFADDPPIRYRQHVPL